MTVANFKAKDRPEPKVWVCDCGNESFWLYEDGRVECMNCATFETTMTGYWKIIDPQGPITLREDSPNAGEDQERQEDSGG